MRELYLFTNDLRLADNPGLLAHVQAEALLCVYCWPRMPPWCNLTGMGAQRERFLRECLTELDQDLRSMGQQLLVLETDPRTAIPQLVELFHIDRVGTSASAGYYERQQQVTLAQRLPIEFLVHPGNTLLDASQLPAPLESLPRQFTPFRKQVQNLAVPTPKHRPAQLPPPPAGVSFPRLDPATARPHPSFPMRGGSREGRRRLQHWIFERQLVCSYKETRNAIDGLDGSSVLSPWLATGALSAREVANQLFDFEQTILKNDSTEWLYQELLWREFFHWRAHIDKQLLFQAGGILGEKKHLRTFEARDFARWCQGHTDDPLVNALMHQLVTSGWMSNRGRQIAASYLVNELNHDWRYGAAFFEKHLIDYDVSSNYGNWQYIAGVGTDPRGGRHFNTAKQTALYDPEGLFCQKWDGYQPPQPRHITDAADWPIAPRER